MSAYDIRRIITSVVVPKINRYQQATTDALGNRVLFCLVLFLTVIGTVTVINWFIKGE